VVVGQHVAEKLGIPAVLALPIPHVRADSRVSLSGHGDTALVALGAEPGHLLGVKGPAMMFGRTVDRWRDVGPAATPWPA